MKNMVFCNVTSCSLTSIKLHGIISQKTVIFKLLLTGFYTYLLISWSRVLLEKLTGSQLVKKFPHCMEPEGSLPHLQVSASFPNPELDQSSPWPPHHTFCRSIIILSSHLCLGLPSGLFPSGFPTKTPYIPLFSPIPATYPAHLILLNLITQIIFYCVVFSTHVTSSLLGPNILLRVLFSNSLSLLSYLDMGDKITGKIIVLYIFVFIVLDS